MATKLQMQKNDNSVKPLPHNLPVSADKDQSESKNDLKNVKDRIQRPCGRSRRPDMQLYVPKAKRNTETRTKSPSKSTREVKNATASSKDTENDDELKKRLISKPVEKRTISTAATQNVYATEDATSNASEASGIASNCQRDGDCSNSECTSLTCTGDACTKIKCNAKSHKPFNDGFTTTCSTKDSTDRTSLTTEAPTLECVVGNIEDSAEELAFHSPPVVQTSSNATVKESTNLSSTSVTVVNNNNNNKLVKEESTNISCVIATFSNSNHFINEEQVTSGHSCVDETCEILRDPTYEKEQHATQEIAMTNDETATKNDTTVSDGSSSIDSTKTSRKDEDSWEKLYSDTGDCLDPTLIDELVSAVGNVQIETPEIDYLSFQPSEPQLCDDDFGHVLELYDFPSELKTEDLISSLTLFKGQGFSIKWVDDTHALAVFSSSKVAADVLSAHHPIIKARPLSQGIRESKLKAYKCAEFLKPYKPRPQTTALLANRLVAGALGLHLPLSKNHEAEKKKLKEAKERKLLAIKQKEEAWEGIFERN